MKEKFIYLKNKIKEEFGSFFYLIKMKFCEFYLSLYTSFCSYVLFYTGYSFDIIVNAFTISSLFQIIVKLLFSIFSIKLSIFLQLLFLFGLIPVYLKFHTFDHFRTFLANFFWETVPESAYYEAHSGWDDEFTEDYNNAWYNRLFLSFIHFFITIRMFLMSEPILSIVLKFIAIRYFILNEYLFLAYTISLVFIFSRFIFLLSDKTLGIWKASIGEILENQEETPKITKKNILILTFWSLRSVYNWGGHIQRELQNLHHLNSNIEILKEKFGLEHAKIEITPKNEYCIKSIIIISFFLVCYFFFYQL